MKHQQFTLAMAASALSAGCAHAQAKSPMTVSISFDFVAGTSPMPAGKYDVSQAAAVEVSLGEAGGKAVAARPIITFLGRHDNDAFPELVFDVLPDGPHLAEVWFPGYDGYLVLASREAHEHRVVQAR